MLKWKHSVATLITTMLCISNPASARFLSNDPVTAQEHLKQGNIQGMNRYAYVNNNPYKFTDPDGRKLVYFAFGEEKSRMEGAINKVAKSNPALLKRLDVLKASANIHIIRQTESGESPRNIPTGPKGSDQNGQGTGSMTAIDFTKSTHTIKNGPNGSYGNFTSSTEAVVAHEVFGHASQVDQGKIDDSRNKIGLKKSEAYGIDTGNTYREAVGEEEREK
jgi:RHS repeat-associated protein